MINTLTNLAACMNDYSLDHPQTKNSIKLLNTRGSFKASLVQVVNEATKAFVSADSSTSRMKMELAAMPKDIFYLIEAASQPDDPKQARRTLEYNKQRIDKAANLFADQAEGVAKQFEGVTNLIMELVQAAIATQGLNEEQLKEIKNKIDKIDTQKKLAEDDNQRIQEEISRQERRTQEAYEEYKEKTAKMGDDTFLATMADALFHVMREATVTGIAGTARKESNENTHVESEKLKASVSGMVEQMKNAANIDLSHYREEQKRKDELNKEAASFRREITTLAASLNTAGVEKLDLQDIIEYLSKGLVFLGRLQETWLEQAKFFRAVANTVSGPLKDTLMEFIEHQNNAIESPQSVMFKKKLLESVIKGCGNCYQVIMCSEIYQEISTKHIMPKLAKATENLQLSKGDAQRQLLNTENEYAMMEEELRSLIKLRKAKMMTKMKNEINSHIKQLAITE